MKVTGSKAIRTALLAFLMISGCLFDGDDGPKYPPLKIEELAGCWYMYDPPPQTLNNACIEKCFTSDSMFYQPMFDVVTPSINDVVEWFGRYTISGVSANAISIDYQSKKNGQYPSHFNSTENGYYLIGDTLYNKGDQILWKYIRSDSLHSCRPHWWFFEKPEGWDLD